MINWTCLQCSIAWWHKDCLVTHVALLCMLSEHSIITCHAMLYCDRQDLGVTILTISITLANLVCTSWLVCTVVWTNILHSTKQICQTIHEFHLSTISNIIIQSLIHMYDVLMKCATRELHITLRVNCTCGYLWIGFPLIFHDVRSIHTLFLVYIYSSWIISVQPFKYRINYSQYHPICY